jgi:asparagine synthase (glutamine-hydrolysing)
MCGIAGILAFSNERPPQERGLANMVSAMRHRGPDEQAFVMRPRVGLGISRLAIIDPAGSHQPLSNENADVYVVFNGEIYNYKELRTTLETAGHQFATKGDGEVIVHGYEQWGAGVFARLRGMFAIALWDERNDCLVLARDRMGVKPLYVSRTPTHLLFASEVKAMFASGEVDPVLRSELMDCYLAFRYVPAPDTLFRGVRKVRPGEYWIVTADKETIETYHRHELGPKDDATEEAAVDRLHALFSRSVEYRLQSDVPLGLFLSGGLDSGFLVALARDKTAGRLDTFSIGFNRGGIYDETAAAEVVARRFETVQHSMHMDHRAFISMLPRAVYHMDEPMADPSAVPMMALSRLASEHVKVVLSGEGGDELFAGYGRYVGEAFAARFRIPQAAAGAAARVLSRTLSRSLVRGIEGIGIRDESRRHLFWQAIVPDHLRRGLIPAAIGRDGASALSVVERFAAESRGTGAVDALDRLFFFDLRSWLVEDLLLKKDKMGMSASIEARVPYLDQDVVAFSLRLPSALKVRGLKGKYVFRRVVAKHLPEEILSRPKVGFAVPLCDWFRRELRRMLHDSLAGSDTFLAEHLDTGHVAKMIGIHSGGVDLSLALFSLLVLELWGRIFLRGEHPEELSEQLARSMV